MTTANGYATEFLVAGLLGFFTMLLLCPTVKYDFRRDHSQLGLLKALPVHPLIVILGQICVPVLLVTGMQLAVLAIHSSLNPTPEAGHRILAVSLLLVPFNVLVFALENLIFLFAPHEEEQNGLEMFVRTVLVFTGKAVLLGLGLYALILWIHGAHLCSRLLRDVGIGFHPNTIFGMGLALAFVSAACVAVVLATAAFERLDVRSMVAGHK